MKSAVAVSFSDFRLWVCLCSRAAAQSLLSFQIMGLCCAPTQIPFAFQIVGFVLSCGTNSFAF
jgi:hypothetical protein